MNRPVRIVLDADDMRLAEEIGRLRQASAESRHLRPVIQGSTATHIRGAQLEIATAAYLGEPMPEDWTLEGDRARKSDIAGWNVRGSYNGDWFLIRPWDYPGPWMFGMTQFAPVIYLMGMLTSIQECHQIAVTRPGKPYKWIPMGALHQLPDWGQEAYRDAA